MKKRGDGNPKPKEKGGPNIYPKKPVILSPKPGEKLEEVIKKI